MSLRLPKVLSAAIALCCVVDLPASAFGQEADGAAVEAPAYELPEIVVDAPKPSPTSKPAKKKAAAAKASASAAPSPDTSSEPEPVEFTDGGPVNDGVSVAGEGPAVSNAGFTSGRVVEQVATVEEVTAEQIERVGARTLDEAIRLMPGVHVRNGGDGVPRIDIRGMRTRNITILVDGVPQNGTFDGQFDPRAIPVENIARIKVTRGGSSVLYGPGGNAAVIDIITKSAAHGLHATGDTSVGFGQNKDARVTASYGSDTVKTFLSASIYEQDAFHLSNDFDSTPLQPNDRRVNSDREDRAFYGNTQLKITKDVQWGFSINYREGEYGKPPSVYDRGTPMIGQFAGNPRFERVDDYQYLSLQTSGLIDLGGGLTLRPMAYFNRNDDLTNRYDDANFNSQLSNGATSEDATSMIFGGGGQLAYRVDERNLVTLAFDGHREDWNANGFSRSTVQVTAAGTGSGRCDILPSLSLRFS